MAFNFQLVAFLLAASASISYALVPKQVSGADALPPDPALATSLASRILNAEFPPRPASDPPIEVKTADGQKVTYSNNLGVKTEETGGNTGFAHPVVFFLNGALFFVIALVACYFLPRLEGVTLGIAGTLEHRLEQRRQIGQRLQEENKEKEANLKKMPHEAPLHSGW